MAGLNTALSSVVQSFWKILFQYKHLGHLPIKHEVLANSPWYCSSYTEKVSLISHLWDCVVGAQTPILFYMDNSPEGRCLFSPWVFWGRCPNHLNSFCALEQFCSKSLDQTLQLDILDHKILVKNLVVLLTYKDWIQNLSKVTMNPWISCKTGAHLCMYSCLGIFLMSHPQIYSQNEQILCTTRNSRTTALAYGLNHPGNSVITIELSRSAWLSKATFPCSFQ